jgi:ATP-dependent Clp protease protease subunit
MTLVPSVTELILAELLYLQYEDNSKPIQLYINSTGTSKVLVLKESLCVLKLALIQEGQKYGYDTEAFAIYDTIQYVKPPVHTIVVGTAWGEAAMLLAAGAKVSMSKICYSLYSKKLFTSGTSCCTSVCQHNDKAAHKLFSRTGF